MDSRASDASGIVYREVMFFDISVEDFSENDRNVNSSWFDRWFAQ
jgi:hypothetical protein